MKRLIKKMRLCFLPFIFVVSIISTHPIWCLSEMENPTLLTDDSIKLIVFDHDDTLVRTIQSKWAQHKYIAKTFYDRDLSDETIRLHWGKPFTVLIKLLYETDNIDMAMSYNIATRDMFPKALFDDTLPLLTAYKKLGKKLGLVTATTASSLHNDFKTLNIPKRLFDYIQTEDDTIFHKPDVRVFDPLIAWMKLEGIAPHEVVYIGDSLNDRAAALSAQFHFIGVRTGLTTADQFAKVNAHSVDCLSDLLPEEISLSK